MDSLSWSMTMPNPLCWTPVDWIVPGRAQQARPADANELQATTVLALPLTEAAAKIRAWGPRDKDADADWPCWSGVLPMSLQPLAPQAHETPDHPLAGAPSPLDPGVSSAID